MKQVLCVRVRVHVRVCTRPWAQGCERTIIFISCLPALDCSSLQNRRPPCFQLWKRGRRNSFLETPSLGESPLRPADLPSVKGTRPPHAREHSRARGSGLRPPPTSARRPGSGAGCFGRWPRGRGGRRQVLPSPRQPCSRPCSGRARWRLSRSFLPARPQGRPHNPRTPARAGASRARRSRRPPSRKPRP